MFKVVESVCTQADDFGSMYCADSFVMPRTSPYKTVATMADDYGDVDVRNERRREYTVAVAPAVIEAINYVSQIPNRDEYLRI